jgi:hypothetical protein
MKLAEWTDPQVQQVYEILCDQTEPPEDEHWEGFAARRIVAALCALEADAGAVAGDSLRAVTIVIPSGYKDAAEFLKDCEFELASAAGIAAPPAEALDHLGDVLYMLAELHEDEQCSAYKNALAYYNAQRPERQVIPVEGHSTRLVHTTPLDATATAAETSILVNGNAIASIKTDTFEILRNASRVWIIEENQSGFRVHAWTGSGSEFGPGVAPPTSYPTVRSSVARLLQLLRIGPVSAQTWPEDICVGTITSETKNEN